MGQGTTYNLTQKVSDQKSGIVLIFSFFENNVPQNWGWYAFFIPKFLVANHGGQATCFHMRWSNIDTDKVLYFDDTNFVGNAKNTETNNTRFGLRYIIGV